MDLTTVERVNRRRGAETTDDQELLGQLITDVSEKVSAYLGRHVLTTARTEVYRVDLHHDVFRVTGFPVTSVTSVTRNYRRYWTDVSALSSTLYATNLATGEVELDNASPYDPTYYQVVYTGGMAADTTAFMAAFPAITAAVDDQVLSYWRRSGTPDATKSGLSGSSMEFPTSIVLLPEVRRTLDGYARRAI